MKEAAKRTKKRGGGERVENKPLKIPLFGLASGRKEIDQRLGISMQQLTQDVPFRYVPHRHDFYHVIWIESGFGTFICDGRRRSIAEGSLIFVPPGQVHTWEGDQPLQGYVLSFDPALLFGQAERPYRVLHELAQWSASANESDQIDAGQRESLQAHFEDLAREFSNRREFREEMLRAQVTGLLILLYRTLYHEAPTWVKFDPITGRFMALLERAEGKLHRVDHYLKELAVSPRVLVDAVLSETGKTPSAWIRDRTLLEAQRLLSHTNLTVSEIAYRLNFRSVSYFVRFFGRFTGLPPGVARRRTGPGLAEMRRQRSIRKKRETMVKSTEKKQKVKGGFQR